MLCAFCCFFSGISSLYAQVSISGRITDKTTQTPLIGAHITLDGSFSATYTDESGNFRISRQKKGKIEISISFLGFKTQHYQFDLKNDTILDIRMVGAPLLGEEVNIIATRAHKKTPEAFTTITSKELQTINLGKDLPFLVQMTPSTLATSDAGNGIGYTGISIRGTDLTRINVTINGIPVNDAESQGVWFVDLPDLASSTDNIQIQRGVGTSTNGAGAFGATINIQTSGLKQDPYGELSLAAGSFGTFKSTLRFGTGLMADKFCVDGRLSYLTSEGYIDRAFSKLKSYYLSAGYYGKNTTFRLISTSGFERTYQAWEGVPKDSLGTNRTYNPAGAYIDQNGQLAYYKDQTDNYQQDNYQAIFSQTLVKNWNMNLAVHYTKGKGYYENYKQGESFTEYGLNDVMIGSDTISTTDLVNRKMMDNDFCGFTFSSNYTMPEKLKVTLGGAWNRYFGRHFGKIIWAQYASNGDNERNWYYNTGLKKDFNIYTKINFQPVKKLNLFLDLQYRNVSYLMKGSLDDQRNLDQKHTFNFFNPKGGISFDFSDRHQVYISLGIANREPSRNNYKDADPDRIPTFETLYDAELGYNYRSDDFSGSVNLYYMSYHDQLVLTGEINNVGEAVMVNVPKSYRLGIEISAGVRLFRKLQWNANITLSSNKIKDFTSYTDNYDSTGQFTGQVQENLGLTDLSFSPDILIGSLITYRPVTSLSFSLNSKFAGRQFIDNTSHKNRSLDPYFVNNLSADYSFKIKPFQEISLHLMVNNLFSRKYETNAWVYQYYYDHQHFEESAYYPQALINFLLGITFRI